MKVINWEEIHLLYRTELFESILPFWINHSQDKKYGGYYTCLLRDGRVYDRDKFVWLQARQVWMFAKLYVEWESNPQWLQQAQSGADFLIQHGRNPHGHWYFSLNQHGKPLVEAYNIFSDCFATMAFAQMFQATQKKEYAQIALETFKHILERKENPKGIYNKIVPETRPLKNFALPMILCNLCLEIESLLDAELVEKTIQDCIQIVMEDFYLPERDLIMENVNLDGSFSDCHDGRLVNPGHALEAMWFVMELGRRNNNKAIIESATERALRMIQYGWDSEYGGIFYFLDAKGFPTQQLEWNQKLWWVHLEAMIAMLMGYLHTQNGDCLSWYFRLHDYCWNHFRDPDYAEWFGYLNRDAKPLYTLKGGKWKGCFHLPRALLKLMDLTQSLSAKVERK